MPISDPIDILLGHDRWASQQILNSCSALTPDQFHQRFEMGPGSLHDTTTHIIGAMRSWTDLLAGREVRPRIEGTRRELSELLVLLDQTTTDFATNAKSHPLDGLVTRERDGKSFTFTRAGVITHVATHGMHHRAQCLNMLRQLGVSPQPQSSVLQWMLSANTSR